MSNKLKIEVVLSSIFVNTNTNEEDMSSNNKNIIEEYNNLYYVRPFEIIEDLYSKNIIKLKIASNTVIKGFDENIKFNTDYIIIKSKENDFFLKKEKFNQYTGYFKEQINSINWLCYNLYFDVQKYMEGLLKDNGDIDITFNNFYDFLNKVNIIFNYVDEYDIIILMLMLGAFNTNIQSVEDINNYIKLIDRNNINTNYIFKILNIENLDSDHLKKLNQFKLKLKDRFLSFFENSQSEKLFLNNYLNIETLYDDYFNKSIINNVSSIRVDKSSKLDIYFNSYIDIYEIFNNFIPSRDIPFINLKDFNKIYRDFDLPREWFLNKDRDNKDYIKEGYKDILKFYIMFKEEEDFHNINKTNKDNYFKCYLTLLNREKSNDDKYIFNFKLSIEIEQQFIKNDNHKKDIIKKILFHFDYKEDKSSIIIDKTFNYIERTYEGYFLYNLVSFLEYIDIPILKHFMTIDDFISFFLLLNEKSSVHKERGGERANFYLDGYGTLLFNKVYGFDRNLTKDKDLYNFYSVLPDSKKIEFKYDKIDNQSRYKKIYKYPNDFKETKNIADVLIIDFTNNNVDKLNITSLQNIMNVLLTYMILNKKDIIELYDECL